MKSDVVLSVVDRRVMVNVTLTLILTLIFIPTRT